MTLTEYSTAMLELLAKSLRYEQDAYHAQQFGHEDGMLEYFRNRLEDNAIERWQLRADYPAHEQTFIELYSTFLDHFAKHSRKTL